MIQVSGLSKEFAARILFQNITFAVQKNERIGLVGRNGTGKSTLLKIITEQIEADSGEISHPKNYSIAMLDQHISFSEDTVLKECMLALGQQEQHDFYKAEKILFGLGFSEEDLQKSPLTFSGGYQIRIVLAKSLLKSPDMLLLDEPTNYLDIVSLRWLERFLIKYPGELILITHDRDFMNKVCTHIMGIHRHKVIKIKGDYNKYWAKIQEDESVYENTRVNQEKKKKELEDFINKFRAKARQASLAQSRQKMLDKMEEFDRLEGIQSINFAFHYKDFAAKTLMNLENISYGYDEKNLFQHLSFFINKGDKIAIIGKNGKGKSTLLNIIGGLISPRAGERSVHNAVSVGHFAQTHINTLHMDNTIEQEVISVNPELSKTAVRNICGSMMFSGDDAEKKISILSGGEKSRVLLGKILAKPTNLLLLDEPTNHLDQESVEILIDELKKFAGAVVIVTHNERILKKLAKKFIIFHHDKCEEFLGSYDDFLNKIGWEDEGIKEEVAVEKISHKDYKIRRSDLIKQRSSLCRPLKDEIERAENEITALEELVELAQQELIKASELEESEKIQLFSKQLSSSQDQIDLFFSILEEKSEKLEQIENEFSQKLNELESLKKG